MLEMGAQALELRGEDNGREEYAESLRHVRQVGFGWIDDGELVRILSGEVLDAIGEQTEFIFALEEDDAVASISAASATAPSGS